MAIGLGVPCWSFGIQHLEGHLPFEGAAQIVRALGFDQNGGGLGAYRLAGAPG